MNFTQQQLVLEEMVKGGQNRAEAKKKVIKHYAKVVRCYEGATTSKLAEIITVFDLND